MSPAPAIVVVTDPAVAELRICSPTPTACYGPPVLGPGDPVPDIGVWAAPREAARPLHELIGSGLVLLCFYLWDWSPT